MILNIAQCSANAQQFPPAERYSTSTPSTVFVNQDLFFRKQWRKAKFPADHYVLQEIPCIREYMPALQKKPKWSKSRRNVQIGDLVLRAEDKVVRKRWPMGRVVKVFTGEDRGVRSTQAKRAGVFHLPSCYLLEEVSDGE